MINTELQCKYFIWLNRFMSIIGTSLIDHEEIKYNSTHTLSTEFTKGTEIKENKLKI